MRFLVPVLLAAFFAAEVRGAVQTKVIEYRHGDTILEG